MPRLSFSLCCWLLLASPALAQRARPAAEDTEARIARIESGLLPRVLVEGALNPQLRLADRMGHHRVPGVSVAVVEGGKVRWARAYGFADLHTSRPMTVQTRLQTSELSMLVSGVGALSLVRGGKLDLDGDVQSRLRSWKIPASPKLERNQVTLRRLLSHSGGFDPDSPQGYDAAGDLPTLLQVLDGSGAAANPRREVGYVPGTRTRSSAGGYAVLQQLMVDVTRTPFAALMERQVLRPAGMTHSTFEQPPSAPAVVAQLATGHTPEGPVSGGWRVYPEQAAGGLWTTAGDLARFIVEVQQARGGKPAVLTRALAQDFLRPGFGEMALGPRVFGQGAAKRFTQVGQGEGFEGVMVGYLDSGQGAVVLTNGEGGMALAHELLLGIAREYRWPDYAPRPAKRVEPEALDPLAGRYLLDPLTLPDGTTLPPQEAEVYVQDGQLVWAPAGLPPRPVFAEGQDRFFALDGAPGVRFVRDAKGKVLGVLVEGGGLQRRGKRLAVKG